MATAPDIGTPPQHNLQGVPGSNSSIHSWSTGSREIISEDESDPSWADPSNRLQRYKELVGSGMRCLSGLGIEGQAVLDRDELLYRPRLSPSRKDSKPTPKDVEYWKAKSYYFGEQYRQITAGSYCQIGQALDKAMEENIMTWIPSHDLNHKPFYELTGDIPDYIEDSTSPPSATLTITDPKGLLREDEISQQCDNHELASPRRSATTKPDDQYAAKQTRKVSWEESCGRHVPTNVRRTHAVSRTRQLKASADVSKGRGVLKRTSKRGSQKPKNAVAESPAKYIRTRSGRLSKPPVRWAP